MNDKVSDILQGAVEKLSKDLEQDLLLGSSSNSTQIIPGLVGNSTQTIGVSNLNGGAGGGTVNGNLTLPPGLSGQTITIGNGTGSTSWTQISKEEMAELEELNKQHEIDVKKAKLDVFKKLSPEIRQRVVDSIIWNKADKEMREITVPISQRHAELRAKGPLTLNYPHHMHNPMWGTHIATPFGPITYPNLTLPEGLVEQDLIDAHTEATMEEHLVGEEDGEKTNGR